MGAALSSWLLSARNPNVEIAAICDVYEPNLEARHFSRVSERPEETARLPFLSGTAER